MDEIDPKEYCKKKPNFPRVAYIAVLLYGDAKHLLVYPMSQLFLEIKDMKNPIKDIFDEFQKKDGKIEVYPQTIVFPLTFEKLVPLKRAYWEGQHENYSYSEKFKRFLELSENPEFYKLLALPSAYLEDLDTFKLEAALPIKVSTSKKSLELFLKNSDYFVDERASDAATYNIGMPMRYNFETGQVDFVWHISNSEKETIAN